MMLAVYGIESGHPQFDSLWNKLYPAFVARKNWEFRQQSIHIMNVYAEAMNGSAARPDRGSTSDPKATYREVSAEAMVANVNASRNMI